MWFNSLSSSINHESVKKAWNVYFKLEQVSLMNISCLAHIRESHRRRLTAGWHDIYVFLKCFDSVLALLSISNHSISHHHHRRCRSTAAPTVLLQLNFFIIQGVGTLEIISNFNFKWKRFKANYLNFLRNIFLPLTYSFSDMKWEWGWLRLSREKKAFSDFPFFRLTIFNYFQRIWTFFTHSLDSISFSLLYIWWIECGMA